MTYQKFHDALREKWEACENHADDLTYDKPQIELLTFLDEHFNEARQRVAPEDPIEIIPINTYDGLVQYTEIAVSRLSDERKRVSPGCTGMFVAIANELLKRENQPPMGPIHPTCFLCQKLCDGLAGNPGKWPVHLGNNRDAHVECVNKALGK